MKEKINKTIITKKGGTIIIPKKIIGSEYPGNSSKPEPGPDPEYKNPEIYTVIAKVKSELNEYSPGHFERIYHVRITRNNGSSSGNWDKLIYSSGYLFKDNADFSNIGYFPIIISAKEIAGRMNSMSFSKTNVSTAIVNQQTSSTVTTDAYGFAPAALLFASDRKSDILAIINNFLDDVEYEINFKI